MITTYASEYPSQIPPASSIFFFADAVKAEAWTVNLTSNFPFPRIFSGCLGFVRRPSFTKKSRLTTVPSFKEFKRFSRKKGHDNRRNF